MRQRVEVGHFEASGRHTKTGLSYPHMMAIFHFGFAGPRRSPLTSLVFQTAGKSNIRFTRAFKAWGDSKLTSNSHEELLSEIGRYLANKEFEIFGVVSPEMPATTSPKDVGIKGPNAPLVDSGELRSKIRHKNTISNTLKKRTG